MLDNNYYKLGEVLTLNTPNSVSPAVIGADTKNPIKGFFVETRISAYPPNLTAFCYEMTANMNTGNPEMIWDEVPPSMDYKIMGTFITDIPIVFPNMYVEEVFGEEKYYHYKKFSGLYQIANINYTGSTVDQERAMYKLAIKEFFKEVGCYYDLYDDIVDHIATPIILGSSTKKPIYGLKYDKIKALGNDYLLGRYNMESLPKGISVYLVVNKKETNAIMIIEPRFEYLYYNDNYKLKYMVLLPDDSFKMGTKSGVKKISSEYINIPEDELTKEVIRNKFKQYRNNNT